MRNIFNFSLYFCVFFLTVLTAFGQEQKEIPILVSSQTIEGKLSENESAVYRINLTSGQFLRITIDQQKVNVALTLYNQEGEALLKSSRFATGASERLSFIARNPGEYKIEVKSVGENNSIGTFLLQCEVKDKPTENDQALINAEKLIDESFDDLAGDLTKEKALAALDKRRRALAVWQKIGERYFESYTLRKIGEIYGIVSTNLSVDEAGVEFYGEPKPPGKMAAEFFNRSLAIDREIKYKYSEASNLDWLGYLYFSLNDGEKALEYYNQSLPLFRSLGESSSEAETLQYLGILVGQSDPQKKLEYNLLAADIYGKIQDQEEEANALKIVGENYLELKDDHRAADYFERSLEIYRLIGSREKEAEILERLAASSRAFDAFKAIEYYNSSLVISRELNDLKNVARRFDDIGETYSELKDFPKALESYNQALTIFREIKDRDGEALALQHIGNARFTTGEIQSALESFSKSIEIWNELGNQQKKNETRQSINAAFDFLDDNRTKTALPFEPGKSIEKQIGGINADVFKINLEAGQFLRLLVEQNGVDLVIKLYDSDNKKLFERDSPTGDDSTESLSFIAPRTGSYRIVLRPFDPNVANGSYELKAELPRAPSENDKIRIAAETAFEEGIKLSKILTREADMQAQEKFEEAAKHWEFLQDNFWEMLSLSNSIYEIGYNEEEKRIKIFKRLALLYKSTGDIGMEASVLSQLASNYSYDGSHDEAVKFAQESLVLYRKMGNSKRISDVLFTIASSYQQAGDYTNALKFYSQSLEINPSAVGSLSSIGNVYKQLGENEKALVYFEKAIKKYEENKTFGDATLEIGEIYSKQGALDAALTNYKKTLFYRRKEESKLNNGYYEPGIVDALNRIGELYFSLKDQTKALEYLLEALELAQKEDLKREQTETDLYLGKTYKNLGDVEKAATHFQEAVKRKREIGDTSGTAKALFSLADFESANGNLTESQQKIEEAIKIVESLRGQIKSDNLRSSYFATVNEYYEFYVNLLMQRHKEQPSAGFDRKAFEASERGRARSLLETLTEARADIRQGADPQLVGRERELQNRLNTKAKEQSESRGDEQANQIAVEIESIMTELEQVKAQIRQTSPRYAALTQPQPLSLKEIQSQILDKDTVLLEYSLGAERSFFWVVTNDSIKTFELPKREEIEQDARQVYALLTNPEGLKIKRGGGETRSSVFVPTAGKISAVESLNRLSKTLLEPAAKDIAGKRLIVVADGALQFVPFSALNLSDSDETVGSEKEYRPLVLTNEVVSLPSASTLAVLRRENEGKSPAPKTVAIFADPVFESGDPRVKKRDAGNKENGADNSRDFPLLLEKSASESGVRSGSMLLPRLPGTRKEADYILSLIGKRQNFYAYDFQANRENVLKPDLADYRYVHFATHGFLNSEHPELSGIALTMFGADGKPQDGFFRLHDVYNLKLNAELVVLSACQTGLGKEIKGEGLVGLTRGFMYAGAPRVAVSLWSVSDEGTAELMSRFYKKMLVEKMRPAKALQEAQISMFNDKDFNAPFYWAAFTLQGEWR